jgi:hypothetical protein
MPGLIIAFVPPRGFQQSVALLLAEEIEQVALALPCTLSAARGAHAQPGPSQP